jgi:hypothetical protein
MKVERVIAKDATQSSVLQAIRTGVQMKALMLGQSH